jgi:hypothetical protein
MLYGFQDIKKLSDGEMYLALGDGTQVLLLVIGVINCVLDQKFQFCQTFPFGHRFN